MNSEKRAGFPKTKHDLYDNFKVVETGSFCMTNLTKSCGMQLNTVSMYSLATKSTPKNIYGKTCDVIFTKISGEPKITTSKTKEELIDQKLFFFQKETGNIANNIQGGEK